jgi:hypothetical protein
MRKEKPRYKVDVAHNRIVDTKPETNWREEWRNTKNVLVWLGGLIAALIALGWILN